MVLLPESVNGRRGRLGDVKLGRNSPADLSLKENWCPPHRGSARDDEAPTRSVETWMQLDLSEEERGRNEELARLREVFEDRCAEKPEEGIIHSSEASTETDVPRGRKPSEEPENHARASSQMSSNEMQMSSLSLRTGRSRSEGPNSRYLHAEVEREGRAHRTESAITFRGGVCRQEGKLRPEDWQEIRRNWEEDVTAQRRAREARKRELHKQWLLKYSFNGVNCRKRSGLLQNKYTYPLHQAVRLNDIFVVRFLLWGGADKSLKDSARLSPLALAKKLDLKGSHRHVIEVLTSNEASFGG